MGNPRGMGLPGFWSICSASSHPYILRPQLQYRSSDLINLTRVHYGSKKIKNNRKKKKTQNHLKYVKGLLWDICFGLKAFLSYCENNGFPNL